MFTDNTFLLIFITIIIVFLLHKKLINNMYNLDSSLYIIGEPNTEIEIISPNPGTISDCYKNPNDKSNKAWTNKDSSQFPIHHTSNITDSLTNSGQFFNGINNIYGDITSPYSNKNIPDRCEIIDNEIYCKINDRLQNIPNKLSPDNVPNIIRTIGDYGDIFTNSSDVGCNCGCKGECNCNADTNIVKNINGGLLNVVMDYGENVNNGGAYFEGVEGYSLGSSNMELKEIDNLVVNYSL